MGLRPLATTGISMDELLDVLRGVLTKPVSA